MNIEKVKAAFEIRTMYTGDCIVWTGGVVFGGYGIAWTEKNKRERAHSGVESALCYVLGRNGVRYENRNAVLS